MGAKEDYDDLNSLAERLQLDEQERDRFVNSSMQRLGYKPRMDWDEPDPEGGSDNGGDFFASKRQQREQRTVGGRQQDQRRASGGGRQPWGYE